MFLKARLTRIKIKQIIRGPERYSKTNPNDKPMFALTPMAGTSQEVRRQHLRTEQVEIRLYSYINSG